MGCRTLESLPQVEALPPHLCAAPTPNDTGVAPRFEENKQFWWMVALPPVYVWPPRALCFPSPAVGLFLLLLSSCFPLRKLWPCSQSEPSASPRRHSLQKTDDCHRNLCKGKILKLHNKMQIPHKDIKNTFTEYRKTVSGKKGGILLNKEK